MSEKHPPRSSGPVERAAPQGADAPLDRIEAWSPNGKFVVLDDASSTSLRLVDVERWSVVRRVGLSRGVGGVRFSADSRRLASVTDPFTAQVVDVEGVAADQNISFELPLIDVALSKDSTKLVATDGMGLEIYALDPDPVLRHRIGGVGDGDSPLVVSMVDDDLFVHEWAGFGRGERLRLWDLRSPSASPRVVLEQSDAVAPARWLLLDDGTALLRAVVMDGAAQIEVVEIPSGRVARTISLPGGGFVNSMVATRDGSLAVLELGPANGDQKLLVVRDLLHDSARPQLIAETDWRISFLTVEPNGKSILYVKGGRIWSLELPPKRGMLSVVR